MSQPIKIAIATEDGIHVSAHFGRAPYFQVLTIENRQVIASERRDKAFHQDDHHHGDHNEAGRDTHAGGMVGVVRDCVAILAGGMGRPAFAAIQSAGLSPILTDIREIAQAGRAYAEGTLVNRPERLH
jgi:predicted Fe-Mo cluster-binding NifX family protein